MTRTILQIITGIALLNLISCGQDHRTMKELNRDKANIHYEVSGQGDTTLLFIHGSYIDQSYWKQQVEHFKNNYRVVTIDLPGHGTSGRERTFWSLDGFAKDVNYVVQELDLERVILVGHSMGADIALLAATASPAPYIGLIAVDHFKNAATPLPAEQVSAILSQLKTDFAGTNEQYARTGLLSDRTPAEISRRVVQDYRNAYQPMGKQLMPELFGFHKMERNLLPRLSMKLYIISVDNMPVHEEPLRHFALHGYKVLHMPCTSHFPMLENPQQLNELLQYCIEEVGK